MYILTGMVWRGVAERCQSLECPQLCASLLPHQFEAEARTVVLSKEVVFAAFFTNPGSRILGRDARPYPASFALETEECVLVD